MTDENGRKEAAGVPDPGEKLPKIRVKNTEGTPKEAEVEPGAFDAMTEAVDRLKNAVAADEALQVTRAMNEAIQATQGLNDVLHRPAVEAIADAIKQTSEIVQRVGKLITPGIKAVRETLNSDAWQEIRDSLLAIAEFADEITDLQPYLTEELRKPEYKGRSIDELMEAAELDAEGLPTDTSLFMKAIRAARAARRADRAAEEAPRTTIKRASTIEYPLDKPNSIIWNLLERDTAGQVSFNMAKHGSKKAVPAYYSINFDELGDGITITKRLLPSDKRTYIAVSALFNAGNNIITLSQIHYAMGNTGRPSKQQLKKINDSITKMTTARIYFDNGEEATEYKYPHFSYDGSLLPLERGTATVNGQLSDAAIHIFREPPLISFAKQRKQITTIDVKLLQSPLSKTDENLLIDDYLLERISKAKNSKSKSCRILLKTLYDHADIVTPKQKTRAPEKINTYLQYYKEQGFITRFTMEPAKNPDSITIYWK